MKALYKEDVNANIRFWGGDLMQKAGTLVKHYRELFYGFRRVLFNLKTILGNIKICKMILQIQT
jgi:lipid-A-disaccharide synthase